MCVTVSVFLSVVSLLLSSLFFSSLYEQLNEKQRLSPVSIDVEEKEERGGKSRTFDVVVVVVVGSSCYHIHTQIRRR